MDVDQLVREAARKVAGDPRAAALFACLRPHFLNPDHDIGSMLRACAASRSARCRLTAILGPLKTWVTRLRMTEAARQVRATGDPDETIGKRLGFSTERGFRRAFRRFHGVSPRRRCSEQKRGNRNFYCKVGYTPLAKDPGKDRRWQSERAGRSRRWCGGMADCA